VAGPGTGDIAHRIRATGSVAYAEETEICPKVEQRILSLDVEEGDSVVKGQVLARLDPTELEAQKGQARAEIRVAEARRVDLQARARGQEIRAAQAAIVQAEGQLDAAVSILEDARRDLERQRQLFAIGGASQQEVDYARTRVESAEAQKGVAQAGLVAVRERLSLLEEGATRTQLALAGEQVAQSEARLAFWQSQADYCVVRAPISGVVTRRHQFVGDLASPRSPILTVANPARLVIRTSLPPDSAIRLRRCPSLPSSMARLVQGIWPCAWTGSIPPPTLRPGWSP
jgi:multidrug resistance efflux pump